MDLRGRARVAVVLVLGVVVVGSACGQRDQAVLGQPVGGCAEAVAERSVAIAAVDGAEKQALARNRARAAELQRIAAEGKHAVVAAADLGSCDDPSGRRGVAVDLADLRARHRVVIERTAAQLDAAAAKPVTPAPRPPAPPRVVGTDTDTRGGDRRGGNRGRG